MANVKNNAAAQETRRRLVEAAGEVFAECGYHAATIKQITDRAQASLAAVNYHFGDKAELYAAVLRRIQANALAMLPPAPPPASAAQPTSVADAARALHAAVRHIMLAVLGLDRPVWHRLLLAREMAGPTPALDPLLEVVARPLHRQVGALVGRVTGQNPSSAAVVLTTQSIIGLCLHYMEHQALLRRLHPRLKADARALADHVADFALAALGRRPAAPPAAAPRAIAGEANPPSPVGGRPLGSGKRHRAGALPR